MPTFGNHVCGKCSRTLKPEKNGITAVELLKDGSPYKIWSADLLKCPICGFELITGFGYDAQHQNFEPDFQSRIDEAKEAGDYYEFY